MFYLVLVILLTQLFVRVGYSESASISIQATSDTNVLDVSGVGFDAQEKVTLELFQNTTKIHTFTENITTNAGGNFTYPITIPSDISGKHILTASTSSKVASAEYIFQQSSEPAPEISATPNNSNIVKVSGTGFNASHKVILELYFDADYYLFPDNVTTDLEGSFSTVVIIPTSLKGACYMYASTGTRYAYLEYMVPILTGATGATGAPGEAANNTLVYIAVVLSVASLITAFYALSRKQKPQERVIRDKRKKRR